MSVLLRNQHYYWIDSAAVSAMESFCKNFRHVLGSKIDMRRPHFPYTAPQTSKSPLVFLCIGTPLIAGDSLGPRTGSALIRRGIPNVYGTLDAPVHAENIELYRKLIKRVYHKPTIIAIDAAIGSPEQEGFITVRKGALKPGSGLGKKIAPIGDVEITGIFENIEKKSCNYLAGFLSRIISDGIAHFILNSLF